MNKKVLIGAGIVALAAGAWWLSKQQKGGGIPWTGWSSWPAAFYHPQGTGG